MAYCTPFSRIVRPKTIQGLVCCSNNSIRSKIPFDLVVFDQAKRCASCTWLRGGPQQDHHSIADSIIQVLQGLFQALALYTPHRPHLITIILYFLYYLHWACALKKTTKASGFYDCQSKSPCVTARCEKILQRLSGVQKLRSSEGYSVDMFLRWKVLKNPLKHPERYGPGRKRLMTIPIAYRYSVIVKLESGFALTSSS